jgi:Glycosyl transferases group 1/PHP-associated
VQSARRAEPSLIAMVADEERAALRIFLRALRSLPEELDWRATVISSRQPAALERRLRERVEFLEASEPELLARADIVVLASEGLRATPGTLVRALAAGVLPVASRLPVYEELLDEGELGLAFEPGDVQTLSSQLSRLLSEPELIERMRKRVAVARDTYSWPRVARDLEGIYRELVARRHDDRSNGRVHARLRSRPLIDVDLHMHTDHSYDCATPVEVLLAEARTRGLGAIAVTDHNEISGALEARSKADGVKVIVGEEVKTADQGEVIGLFIEEKIPRGGTLAEVIAEIKRQRGLVYVPHPFDRLHSVPDYEHLLGVLDDVDAIEVFNPRVAITEFNEEAVRFAAKYRIPAGAGSDAHVPQGLGSVRIRMRDFDGPDEFLESLRDADIIRNPASLLYVQALKFLQTKAMPPAARRAARDRRVRRAARKP